MKFLAALNKLALTFGIIMLASLMLSHFLEPKNLLVPTQPDFEKLTPTKFGDWQEVKSNLIQVGLTTNTDEKDRDLDNPYDQVLMRTYENSRGQRVMLALAWGQKQQQEVKIHRPELCYAAQGFVVSAINKHKFEIESVSKQSIIGKQMIAKHGSLTEAVTYWIRIGDSYSESALWTRLNILKGGLEGLVYDGILVRVSTVSSNAQNTSPEFKLNEVFLNDLITNADPVLKQLLVL